ncbi:MAG: DUF1552 domain-containing protein [Planctomycetota bacterium]|jgi:hypothetical protein
MNILSGKHLSRRTVLRGMGASLGLPLLDAMVPARAKADQLRALSDRSLLICIEMVHGAAGSNAWGRSQNFWSPAEAGGEFDLSPSALLPLEPYRNTLNIVSDTDVRSAEAWSPKEIGGDHFRSTATFLTQSHPKQTEGSDVQVGTSLDQIHAQRFGQDTPIPSMQLCIENINQSGGCAYGYTCVYTDTLSWASPEAPLPVIRDPRVAFEQLFGAGGTQAERVQRRRTRRSILDWVGGRVSQLRGELGPADRDRLDSYLQHLRELERRIERVEARNRDGNPADVPAAPSGVPDSFEEHMRLMFDLMVLAFESDTTRVFSFKMSRDSSARVFPESGVNRPFHPASHHGGREKRVTDFYKINKYHVSMLPYLLDKLQASSEGDASLLDKSLVIYGSPMGDSNLHNHKRCPLITLGGLNGKLSGNRHLRAEPGTPMANVMLSLMHKLGHEDMERFGDSSSAFPI